ncbi:hypothetical protein TMEC50S_01045 [Thauera mechernichensis]
MKPTPDCSPSRPTPILVVPQLPPSTLARMRGAPSPVREKSWMTPPAWLPYTVEKGPRITSMRSAVSRLKVAAWP